MATAFEINLLQLVVLATVGRLGKDVSSASVRAELIKCLGYEHTRCNVLRTLAQIECAGFLSVRTGSTTHRRGPPGKLYTLNEAGRAQLLKYSQLITVPVTFDPSAAKPNAERPTTTRAGRTAYPPPSSGL